MRTPPASKLPTPSFLTLTICPNRFCLGPWEGESFLKTWRGHPLVGDCLSNPCNSSRGTGYRVRIRLLQTHLCVPRTARPSRVLQTPLGQGPPVPRIQLLLQAFLGELATKWRDAWRDGLGRHGHVRLSKSLPTLVPFPLSN